MQPSCGKLAPLPVIWMADSHHAKSSLVEPEVECKWCGRIKHSMNRRGDRILWRHDLVKHNIK